MRNAITICLLAATMGLISVGNASACIRFDRKAELRLVNTAIAARSTPADIKVKLRKLRPGMMAFRGDDATMEALKLIGKDRIAKPALTNAEISKGAFATGGCG